MAQREQHACRGHAGDEQAQLHGNRRAQRLSIVQSQGSKAEHGARFLDGPPNLGIIRQRVKHAGALCTLPWKGVQDAHMK